jgi:hypothetical protein
MNYYYDPILGLQYDYLGELFLIGIDMLPQDTEFNIEYWIKYINQTGVMLVDSVSSPIIERVLNITNYKL